MIRMILRAQIAPAARRTTTTGHNPADVVRRSVLIGCGANHVAVAQLRKVAQHFLACATQQLIVIQRFVAKVAQLRKGAPKYMAQYVRITQTSFIGKICATAQPE